MHLIHDKSHLITLEQGRSGFIIRHYKYYKHYQAQQTILPIICLCKTANICYTKCSTVQCNVESADKWVQLTGNCLWGWKNLEIVRCMQYLLDLPAISQFDYKNIENCFAFFFSLFYFECKKYANKSDI